MRRVMALATFLGAALLPFGAGAQMVPPDTGHTGLWMSPGGGNGQPPAGTLPPEPPGHTGLWMAPNDGVTPPPVYNGPRHRSGGDTVVSFAPPAVLIEAPAVRPDHGHPLWTSGTWGWDGQSYQWIPGRWQEPPRAGMVWSTPQWRRHGHHWTLRAGAWRPGVVNPPVHARSARSR